MAEIRDYHGRPAIWVDGVPHPPMMATIRTNDHNRMVIDREYYRQLGRAGIRIFFLICDTLWLKPNALTLFREEAEALLEVVPDAYIVPRIGLHPTNDWIRAHPEETVAYDDGSRPTVHLFTESYVTELPAHYSLCSAQWREDAGNALLETWEAMLRLPYADRIIGCFLAAGGTSEWYYILPVISGQRTLDHGGAFRRAFTAYLTEKYGTDEALQSRWHDPAVTLAQPRIPETAAHYFAAQVDQDAAVPPYVIYANSAVPVPPGDDTHIGSFLNMNQREDVFDFYRAWHLGTAASVAHFAELIKRRTPDRLVGAFYGAFGCTDYLSNGTCGGAPELLRCPYLDFLSAPGVYENRQPGGFTGQREMCDSFALHNKIYIIEDDTRTHMENRYFREKYGMFDLCDSVDVMKREFGRTLCEDVQAWWFDQLLGGARYKVPELYALISRQQEIARQAYQDDRRKVSEIAYLYDAKSAQLVSQQTSFELIELQRDYEVARIGAPVDSYFVEDMADPAMPDYKLYVFWNTFLLTDDQRRMIREKLARNHAVAVWMYASGVVNPDAARQFDVANITALTGIRVRQLEGCFDPKFRFTDDTHPLAAGLEPRRVFGSFDRVRRYELSTTMLTLPSYLYPLFAADDPDAAVPARFLTSDAPAITVKETGGFTSVLYAAKLLRAELLRNLARLAHCHIYSESDDVLFANRRYITFHCSQAGEKLLRLPRPCSPYEVYEERYYGRDTRELRFTARLGETKMFRLDDASSPRGAI